MHIMGGDRATWVQRALPKIAAEAMKARLFGLPLALSRSGSPGQSDYPGKEAEVEAVTQVTGDRWLNAACP